MSDQFVADLQKHISDLQSIIEAQQKEIEKLKRVIELVEMELDQNKFYDDWVMIPTSKEQCALDLFIESVYKPDFELRAEAREQDCYDELMELRSQVIEMLHAKKASMEDHIKRHNEPEGEPSF